MELIKHKLLLWIPLSTAKPDPVTTLIISAICFWCSVFGDLCKHDVIVFCLCEILQNEGDELDVNDEVPRL